MTKFQKFLRAIGVLQYKKVAKTGKPQKRTKIIGYNTMMRVNPYHPISYIVLLVSLIGTAVINLLDFFRDGQYNQWLRLLKWHETSTKIK